jgi:hypothetical protein
MILAALGPAAAAVVIFVGTLFPPKRIGPTKAQRERIAASSREVRAGLPIVCWLALLLLVAPLTVAALHTFADRGNSFVMELR